MLVVRVHPELLAASEAAARSSSASRSGSERFKDIRAFERHLARNGIMVLKFFLHVSKEEQRRRFLDRLDEPAKRWKFSMGDIAERAFWDQYMAAYEDMIRATSRARGALVCGAGRPQVVRLAGGGGRDRSTRCTGSISTFPRSRASATEMQKVRAALMAEGGAANGKAKR